MRTMLVVAVTLIVSAGSASATAQSISVNRIEISSDAARKLVEACVAYAERNKVLVGAAVVGIDGVLIDFHLMQGATATNSETAILKAKTFALGPNVCALANRLRTKRSGSSRPRHCRRTRSYSAPRKRSRSPSIPRRCER